MSGPALPLALRALREGVKYAATEEKADAIGGAVLLVEPVNPLLAVDWYAAYWASDLELSDGDAVSVMPDSTGNGRSAEEAGAVGAIRFVASDPLLGGKPALRQDKPYGERGYLRVPPERWGNLAESEVSLFFVGYTLNGEGWVVGSQRDMSGQRSKPELFASDSVGASLGKWGARRTATQYSVIDSATPSAVLVTYNAPGAEGLFRVNGVGRTSKTNFINPGVELAAFDSLQFFTGFNGNSQSQRANAAIAFVGIREGAFTREEIENLEEWANAYYGVPV